MGERPRIRQEFAALVARPDEAIALDRAALLVAAEEYPDLDITAYQRRLDLLAAAAGERIGPERQPAQVIAHLNRFLFDELGFRGNSQDYYDPRNSFLNEVLDRRLGIPLTLSLVYLEIGRRLGLPLRGVGLPGHFIVLFQTEPPLYLDPFNRGTVLTVADCAALVARLAQGRVHLRPAHLQPVGPRQILWRLLLNLKYSYLRRNDLARALGVIDRLLLLRPEALTERRDRGLVRYRLGHLTCALVDLHAYLQAAPSAPDAAVIRQKIREVRRLIGWLN